MHNAPLPPRVRQIIGHALDQTATGVGNDQFDALETAVDQVAQESRPARLVLLGALADAEDLTIALGCDADRNEQ